MNVMKGIMFLAIAVGLFALFRISNIFAQSIANRYKSYKVILRVLPWAELLGWLIFVLWLLNRLFSEWEGYTLTMIALVSILMLIAAWYFMRDFIAGTILKGESAFTANQHITTPEISGTIRNVGYRTLEVESESGQFTKIPYSRLSGQIFSIQAPAETMLIHELILEIPSSTKFENIKEQVIKELLLLPWVSVNHDPVIKTVQENNETITLKVSFQATSNSQAYAINQHMRKIFEGR